MSRKPQSSGALLQIPGLEVAEKVILVAADVTECKVGDKVCALVSGGGYAEYRNAPVPQVLPIPEGLSMIEGAGVPEELFYGFGQMFFRKVVFERRNHPHSWRI